MHLRAVNTGQTLNNMSPNNLMSNSPPQITDFLSLYLSYTEQTESPAIYHKYCALTALSAWIGRDIYFPFGHGKIHINMYTMLVGLAGTKKSTAIKISAKLLKKAGYKTFSASKTRQEKFLIDLAEQDEVAGEEDILDQNLWGEDGDGSISAESRPPAECFVAADEINNFIGVGNLEFMSILGDLWDMDEVFSYKLKNSKSVVIPYPTISLLGGNTFAGLNRLFPPDAIDQGFFSRLLFIYADPIGRKFSIPPSPPAGIEELLIKELKIIKSKVQGKVTATPKALDLIHKIYMEWKELDDPRFDSYANRRDIHLLKLTMLYMAIRHSTVIEVDDIIKANTLLTFTEHLMPKALGEYGRGRNSEVTHKVLQLLDKAHTAQSIQDIWKHVHQDLEKRDQLMEIIGNLTMADKIQSVEGGFLPKKAIREPGIEGTVDWELLTQDEINLMGVEL